MPLVCPRMRIVLTRSCSTGILTLFAIVAVAQAAELTRTPVKGGHRACLNAAWHITESKNFRVMRYGTEPVEASIAAGCESLRSELVARWLGADADVAWLPKCDLVLHDTSASYVQAVGAGGAATIASTLVDQQKGKIRQRRIDVRVSDPQWQVSALPHELTHVVLTDRFVGQRLPRWADEGLAILADPATKQDGHLRDFRRAVATQDTFRTVELLALEDYPAANRWAAFYGQSASLTHFLVRRGTPEQFVAFLQLSLKKGYEPALRETYNIGSVAELERQWNSDLVASRYTLVSSTRQLASSALQPAALSESRETRP